MITLGCEGGTHLSGAPPADEFGPIVSLLAQAGAVPRSVEAERRFHHFELLGEVGSGGMGIVYRARDDASGRLVALKVIHDRITGESAKEADQRLIREARVLAQVRHPNIVSIVEAGVWEGRRFIAMELVDGRTLNGWRREGPRSVADVVEVFAGVGAGLAAAHRVGLVHRDLKPANILVDTVDCPKITDFGLARRIQPGGTEAPDVSSRVTRPGVVPGTAPYMPPEQFRGAALDPRSDQFSFFVCLHEALTGSRPFPGVSFDDAARAILHGRRLRPDMLSSLPPDLVAAMDRGLATEPRNRFADMDTVLEALRHLRAP
jgi:serine/threonine protein kinase